ncbi:MAG: TIGR02281 family clan AA aspartic protease [Rhodobacteraceae bacterium]|nr:TIGR02281 family clan AA aspartic protease [Paracoccaceae bacterium]
MRTGDWEQLVYYGILLAALLGGVLLTRRGQMGKTLRQFGLWALIFGGIVMAYGIWEDISRNSTGSFARENEQGNVVLEKQRDGHFHATVVINGAPIDTLVDTGATLTVLTAQDAARAGFDMDRLQFSGQARTANGIVATAPVRLNRVALGPFEERNVRAAVNGGNLDKSLLGMEFLNRFGRLEITRDQLIITK